MKKLQGKLLSPAILGTIRQCCRTPLARNADLHSHSKFMEASSNVVNIFEVNSISVYDLKSHYERLKAKAYGKQNITLSACFLYPILSYPFPPKLP